MALDKYIKYNDQLTLYNPTGYRKKLFFNYYLCFNSPCTTFWNVTLSAMHSDLGKPQVYSRFCLFFEFIFYLLCLIDLFFFKLTKQKRCICEKSNYI